MTAAPASSNPSTAAEFSASELVPSDIRTAVNINIDAVSYEAALERLITDGSRRGEEDLKALLSQFLAVVAVKGAEAASETCGLKSEAVQGFYEARKKQVAEAFMRETPQECLRRLTADIGCGCDGGNWNSSLWVFGLEYGGTQMVDDDEGPFVDLTYYAGQEYDYDYLTNDEKRGRWLNSYPYNRYLLKFCLSFFGLCSPKEAAEMKVPQLMDRANKARLFAPDGPCFKGNLFPLQRPNHNSWKSLKARWKGINFGPIEKVFCYGDCEPNDTRQTLGRCLNDMVEARRPGFKAKLMDNVKSGIPTVIVCWGITALDNFARAFGTRPENFQTVDIPGLTPPRIAEIKLDNPDNPAQAPSTSVWIFVMPHYRVLSPSDEWIYAMALREYLASRHVTAFWNLSAAGRQV